MTAGRVPLVAVAALLALGGCGSDPNLSEVVDEHPSFAECVEATGASLDGSSDWDADQALAFWGEPGTLDCAVDELDDGARRDALATAFPAIEADAEDRSDALEAQRSALVRWARGAAEKRAVEEVVARAVTLLRSTWAAEADYPATNGLTSAAVLGAMLGGGELESYEAYLADHPDAVDSAFVLVRFSTGGEIDPDEQSRFFALRDEAVDDVRRD